MDELPDGNEKNDLGDDDDDDLPHTTMQNGDIPSTSYPTKTSSGGTLGSVEGATKRLKIEQLYKFLDVEGDADTIDIDKFKVERDTKTNRTMLYFLKDGSEVRLTKKKGEFKAPTEISRIMGGLAAMKGMLGLDETPPLLEKSIQEAARSREAARDLNKTIPTDLELDSIPLEDLNGRIHDVDSALQEASKDTGLPVRELLALDKTLQRIQGELANNVGKLGKIQAYIEHKKGRLRDMLNDPSYTDEQRDEVKKSLRVLKDEHSVRLEIATQNKEALSTQFARIKQTLEKIADGDTSLKERIKILWREQGVTLISVLTAVGMAISTIFLAIKNAFGIRGNSGTKKPPSNDPNTVKNWVKGKLKALARLLKKLGAKALSSLPTILGSVISWVLNKIKKGILFMAEYTYAFITFIATIIGYWIYEQIKKKKR